MMHLRRSRAFRLSCTHNWRHLNGGQLPKVHITARTHRYVCHPYAYFDLMDILWNPDPNSLYHLIFSPHWLQIQNPRLQSVSPPTIRLNQTSWMKRAAMELLPLLPYRKLLRNPSHRQKGNRPPVFSQTDYTKVIWWTQTPSPHKFPLLQILAFYAVPHG